MGRDQIAPADPRSLSLPVRGHGPLQPLHRGMDGLPQRKQRLGVIAEGKLTHWLVFARRQQGWLQD